MGYEIHDEWANSSAEGFLATFLPVAGASMARRLGRQLPSDVHVVLSPQAKHLQRFPRRADEMVGVLNPYELEEVGGDPEALLTRYPASAYAHGVATLVHPRHDPPPAAALGEPGIYLDMDAVEAIAKEVDVPFEGMLGRVATHELSHILRGHADETATPVHGWLAEGDAQRDTWLALTETLADPTWHRIARWGRAAQVRLAEHQPPAYSHFDATSQERRALSRHRPVEPAAAWLLEPPRAVFILAREGTFEIPFVSTLRAAPVPGDTVYLIDWDMLAGPWVVTARAEATRVNHPLDRKGIELEGQSKYTSGRPAEWLHVRPAGSLVAGSSDDVVRPTGLRPSKLEADDVAALSEPLTLKAADASRAVAKKKADAHQETLDEWVKSRAAAGKPVPVFLTEPYDPFDDWRE